MTLDALLADLGARGVALTVEHDRLVIRAPKGALTPELRDALATHRDALLDHVRGGVVEDPEARYRPFPLTPMQEAYLVGRSPGIPLGGVSCWFYVEYDLRPGLAPEAIERAWRELVDRHDMLRSVVSADATQRVLPEVPPYVLEVVDLRGLPAAVRDLELAAIRDRSCRQVRPADTWPLFDLRATRLDGGRTRLHLGVDLLTVDALSLFLLFGELRARLDGEPLAPLGLGFRDYLAAIGRTRGGERERARRYWEGRADTLPSAPDLPLAGPLSAVHAPRFERLEGGLPAEVWARLQAAGAARGLTPSNVLCAAFAEVLRAWSREPAATLVLTLFDRHPIHPDVARIVGDLSSTLLLGLDGRGGTFAERARALQARLLADLDHRDASGVEVLRALARRGRPTLLPVVFTSTLGYRQIGTSPYRMSWLGDFVYGITQTPQVAIDHQVFQDQGALVHNWDVVPDAFAPGVLDAMFDAYGELLRALADGPAAWDRAGLPLPPRTAAVRRAVAATEGPLPDGLLHDPFDRRARAEPDRIAVVSSDRTLRYGELRDRALALAETLRGCGVGPEDLVAVRIGKGWEQVVAVLAVSYAGGAWVPMDPELPTERLRWLVEHTGARVVIDRPGVPLPAAPGVHRLEVPTDPPIAPTAPAPTARPDHLAYVIFTSGSTGEPKGVMIEHRAALNTIVDVNERFAVGPADRILGVSALSFDLSVWDVFGTLAAGATLVLPRADRQRDPAHWHALVDEGVTVWNSAPALMEMLVTWVATRSARLDGLRLALLSGDWIPVRLPDALRELARDVSVVSLGGATEAAIWSIAHPIGEVDPRWTSIPYGRPLRNQRVHVLDAALEPVPDQVTGELWIGGAGLARGYWRDPERTAARFPTHPRTGERLYRTGDLGRAHPDGTLEFLGRDDLQVKIQGFRIELGEIEATLAQHPDVREVAVVAQGEPRTSNRWLAAFVVPARAAPPAAGIDPDKAAFVLREPGLRRVEPTPDGAVGLGGSADPVAYRRRSCRSFDPAPLTTGELGAFLEPLRALPPEPGGGPLPRYRYPSAGNLYPVQVYLHVKDGRVDGLRGGTWLYDRRAHALVPLSLGEAAPDDVHAEVNRPVYRSSALSVWLVADHRAIAPAYGDRARDLCLLEAGGMAQLLADGALGTCAIGGLAADRVHPLFRGEAGHELVHVLEVGRPAAAGAADLRELRVFLADRLPAHLVPARIALVDALPLSSNGKIDRGALSRRVEAPPTAASAPATSLEATVAEALREALGVERVDLETNFFELGASSVQLLSVATSLEARLGRPIPNVTLFEHPSVRALARALAETGERGPSALDPARARGEARRRRRGEP